MTWKPTRIRIGICGEDGSEVIMRGDPLLDHVEQCKYYEQGKPKSE